MGFSEPPCSRLRSPGIRMSPVQKQAAFVTAVQLGFWNGCIRVLLSQSYEFSDCVTPW